MKSSIIALSTLLWAGPVLAGPCRPVKPSSASSSVAAVSSSSAPPPPASSSTSPIVSDIVGTPASSSPVPSTFSSVFVPPSSSAPAPPSSSSSPAPAPSSSAPGAPSSSPAVPSSSTVSSTSSAALPSSSGGGSTTNPGEPSCSTENLFVDSDLTLGLSYWPSNVITGSPTCSLGANCGTSSSGAAYAACLELDLVTLGQAEGIAFHQKVTTVKNTVYAGYFHYRLPALGASGKSMATLTCTMNGQTKYSVVLCDNDVSQTWQKKTFTYTADCTEATFECKVTTSAVTAQLQFTDFYLGAQC